MQRCLVALLETCLLPARIASVPAVRSDAFARIASVPAVHSDAFEVKPFILFGVSWNEPTAFVQRSNTIRWQHTLRFRLWPVLRETDVELVHFSVEVLN